MQLLAAVQDACDRLSLTRVTAVATPGDQTARSFLGFAQQEARELSRRNRWSALTAEQVFTAVAAEVQPTAVPADFSRMVNGSFWNRSQRRPVQGPLTPNEWQNLKALGTIILPDRYMLRGTVMSILPAPTAGSTFAYEYVSKYPVVDNAGAAKAAFTADDDEMRVAAHVLPLALVWRYRAALGFDYAEDFRSYETAVIEAMQADGGRRNIDMSRASDIPSTGLLVPEGNWTIPI